MAQFDNYLPCDAYAGAPSSDKYPGFNVWHDAEANLWYFAVVTNTGRVVLRSEGYTSEAGRDNGIESVMRNRDIEERYSVAEEDGKWYVILKAGNRQEIARSCAYDSEADATAGIAACASTYTERAAKSAGVVENYMPCDYYAGQAASDKYPGFLAWQGVDSGEFFFSMVDNKGKVLMRSESYTTEKARDNGIESVNKNRDIEARYAVIEEEGEWFLILKAGNHQEIARSCGYESEAAALAAIATCSSTANERSASSSNQEDYLDCDAYHNHPNSEKYPGFHTFEVDGQYYFAMADGHDEILLRSEGYTKEASRDNGIESVMRNRDIEERYSIVQDEADGQWYVSLKAGNRQEIARSCGFADQAGAENHKLHCFTKKALERMATGADQIIEDYLPCEAYAGHPESPNFKGFTIFQDEESGLHYFAMLDDDGKVALKSEGYKDPKRRDNGIESVLRNRGIKDHWREQEDEHGHYMSLRAVNHQEIARTCHYKDKAAMIAWFLPLVAGHAAWASDAEPEEKAAIIADPVAKPKVGVSKAPETALESTKETDNTGAVVGALGAVGAVAAAGLDDAEKPATKVIETAKKATPPPVTSYTEAATDMPAAGGGWWKWLLGLALLGLLAWLLLRGCDGCGAKKVEVPGKPVTTVPAQDTTRKATPPPPPPAATCNCSGNPDALFNAPTGTAKKLSRLGTNPEFGDSHALTPAEFLAKVQARAKANAADQRFMDRVFKGMGYKGFSEAKPEMFSNVVLPVGTSGNLGYSKAHKTGYYTLPDNDRDRQAFRIKSANGCDFHFMKTCGNHFFFCSK
jgi:uncharacterized protein YegP (UPF0339 family)